MADPLSVTASAIAVLGIGTACAKTLLSIIQSIHDTPDELMALSNEVNNVNAIIDEARKVCGSLATDNSSTVQFKETLKRLLKDSEVVLGALNNDLVSLGSKSKSRAQKLNQSVSWLRRKTQVRKYLMRLRDIRTNITALLTSKTVSHTLRIGMDMQELRSTCEQMSQQIESSAAKIIRGLLPQQASPESLLTRSPALSSETHNGSQLDKSKKQNSPSDIRYSHTQCEEESASSDQGYTGSSPLRPNCDKSTCQNRTGRSFQFTYCFPQWLLERAIHIVAAMTYTGTPIFGLEVRRRIGWGGEDGILRFALTGNTLGVKSLLEVGKASMTDVDPNHGRTALYYAVQYNRIETCEFLLNVGADPHAQDDDGISSYQKAWEQVFTRYGSSECHQALQRLFPKEAISETWEFSQLHEVVLDILPMSLEGTLQDKKYREQINIRDYKGRTPLHWAAIRGDVSAVSLLLDNGAEVNAQDESKATPLILAASSGSVRTLELLLLAGANVRLTDMRGGHALHYVCRHQKDIAPVKLLLQAGAPLNCRNIYGHTPFIGAAIKNRYQIGLYLLQHGADIHNGSNNNDTPLFESIFHNSHEFLRLLLREGAKHTHVNKSGSTILHAAALEADIETIEILAASRLEGLDIHLLDKNGKTAREISKQRIASPDGFQEAFERFLGTAEEENYSI